MTATFHRQGELLQFNIEEDGRHLCRVFDEADARRIVEALNAPNAAPAVAFVRSLTTIGLGDPRSAEVLLGQVRVQARAIREVIG